MCVLQKQLNSINTIWLSVLRFYVKFLWETIIIFVVVVVLGKGFCLKETLAWGHSYGPRAPCFQSPMVLRFI